MQVKDVTRIEKHRQYSDEFKQKVVSLFETGKYSIKEIEKLYGVHSTMIYRWIYKFSKYQEKGVRILEMEDSSVAKIKALEEKVKQLERAVGQKQIKIDYLEKMIDIAAEDYNIEIKKTQIPHP
ncbi:MAG: transposase [Luteibaculaceae bacterium]